MGVDRRRARPSHVVRSTRTSQNGRVVAFNASAFAGTNPHEFLSNYAVRYQDPNQTSLNDISNFIAPEVPAQTSQFVEYALYNFSDGYAVPRQPQRRHPGHRRGFPDAAQPASTSSSPSASPTAASRWR